VTVALTHREQLIALFAGEQEDGEWVTTPCYTIPLAIEICRAVDPASEVKLRQAIYGDQRPPDAVPGLALEVIGLAFNRWVQIRNVQKRSRGLR
jgi:hypothetical protein